MSLDEAARLSARSLRQKALFPYQRRRRGGREPEWAVHVAAGGALAGVRRIPTTLNFDYVCRARAPQGTIQAELTKAAVKKSAEEGDDASPEEPGRIRSRLPPESRSPTRRRSAPRPKRATGSCSSAASRPPKATLSTSRSHAAQSSSAGRLRSLSPAVSIDRKCWGLDSKFSYLLPGPPSRGKVPSWQSCWHKPRKGL